MKRIGYILLVVTVMLLQACGQSESLTLTLVHYNVGVFSKTDSSSVAVVADAVRELRADVVSLNELDNMVFRTGLKDQLALFSSEMGGWNSVFAPAMPFQGGRYGVGLSAEPGLELLRMDKVRLPQLNGQEPRAMAVMEFGDFVVASTHLDHKSAEARLGQVHAVNHYIDSVYSGSRKPIFLCGDFNCLPESNPISLVKQTWQQLSPSQPTYPADFPAKCIDYIFVRPNGNEIHVNSASVPTDLADTDLSTASDHLPVVVTVTIKRLHP